MVAFNCGMCVAATCTVYVDFLKHVVSVVYGDAGISFFVGCIG